MPLLLFAAVSLLVSAFSLSAQQPASSPSLDFEFFRTIASAITGAVLPVDCGLTAGNIVMARELTLEDL